LFAKWCVGNPFECMNFIASSISVETTMALSIYGLIKTKAWRTPIIFSFDILFQTSFIFSSSCLYWEMPLNTLSSLWQVF
jgi:hypothetical protein